MNSWLSVQQCTSRSLTVFFPFFLYPFVCVECLSRSRHDLRTDTDTEFDFCLFLFYSSSCVILSFGPALGQSVPGTHLRRRRARACRKSSPFNAADTVPPGTRSRRGASLRRSACRPRGEHMLAGGHSHACLRAAYASQPRCARSCSRSISHTLWLRACT